MTDATRDTKSLRHFGLVLGSACAVFGAVALWRGRASAPYFGGLAGLLVVLGLVAPSILRPVERVWMALGERLGKVSTTVILTATFYLVVTPLGVLRRLMGHDDLGLRIDRDRPSYWTPVDRSTSARIDKPY